MLLAVTMGRTRRVLSVGLAKRRLEERVRMRAIEWQRWRARHSLVSTECTQRDTQCIIVTLEDLNGFECIGESAPMLVCSEQRVLEVSSFVLQVPDVLVLALAKHALCVAVLLSAAAGGELPGHACLATSTDEAGRLTGQVLRVRARRRDTTRAIVHDTRGICVRVERLAM